MKMCKCTTCGQMINLREKPNILLELMDRGYKYSFYEYYVVCPYCGSRKQVKFDDLPFRIKWQILKKTWAAK